MNVEDSATDTSLQQKSIGTPKKTTLFFSICGNLPEKSRKLKPYILEAE